MLSSNQQSNDCSHPKNLRQLDQHHEIQHTQTTRLNKAHADNNLDQRYLQTNID